MTPAPEGDSLRIRFRKSHAIHVLKSTRRVYGELKRVLEEAAASGQPVSVVADPREMEIVAVRPAPVPAAEPKH